jgi:hypothetical protein
MRFNDMPEKDSNYVKWITFVWVVGIVSVLMGAMFFMIISLMTSFSDIKSDVSSIKTDVSWIKGALDNEKTVSIN